MKARFHQADRSTIELEADGFELAEPWDSTIHVTMPLDGRSPDAQRRRQLHIAHAGNYDYIIETHQQGSLYHRLSAHGGEFLVYASSDPERQGTALWRGPHHEVATFVPNSRDRDPAVALRPLMGLTFQDSPEGLTVTPEPVLQATLSVFESSTYVRGVGQLDVRHGPQALGMVPSWRGAKVPAGEVWKVDVQEEGDTEHVQYLQMATPSAVLLITPSAAASNGQGPAMGRALEFARAIRRAAVSKGKGPL